MTATGEDQNEKAKLEKLIRTLRRFNEFDPKMQVSTILTLLEITEAELKGDEISVQDLEKKIGLLSGTASRNVYYWGEGHKQMPSGGHEMVTVGMSSQDRRKRTLKLSHKGKAFMRNLLEGV